MSDVLCITARFLDPMPGFHGRADGGGPEWPPSPLRLFQALVDAAASRWRGPRFDDYAKTLLMWMENLTPPSIIAPVHHFGIPVRIAVPNNDLDVWAGPLSRGSAPKKQPNELKTMKTVRPTHLAGDAVHYLYPLPDGGCPHEETLKAATRSITHLGWGVDMVAGDASVITEEKAAKLEGERWRPTQDESGTSLRVPCSGTLTKLMEKHEAFLNRLSKDGFKPVPPLTRFDVVGYRRETDVAPRPFAAFELHKTVAELAELPAGKSRFRPFNTVRKFAHVAGMVRNAAKRVAEVADWGKTEIETFICGHGEGKHGQANTDNRLMYLPLPSITPLKVESVRRVLVVGPPGYDISRIRRLLNGCELFPEGQSEPVAMLSVISQADRIIGPYVGSGRVWSTVTPVALPGFDDPNGIRKRLLEKDPSKAMTAEEKRNQLATLDRRIRGLIGRAFEQAGFLPGILKDAIVEWRSAGFRAGVDLAGQYVLDPLKYPRYHVRVKFAHEVRGPLAVGAGRYRGMGLFAIE